MGLQGAEAPEFAEVLEASKRDNVMLRYAEESRSSREGMSAAGRAQISEAFAAARASALASDEGLKLSALFADLSAAVEANKEELLASTAAMEAAAAETPESDAAKASGGKLEAPDVDRWARVGMFVGSAGGPATDYNRRTATATERLAQLASRTNELLRRLEPLEAATWA
jgi:hypothetical protein